MFPFSHLMAGFLLAAGLKFSGLAEITGPLIALAALTSIIPDTDGLFVKDMSNHHEGPLHAPDFWAIIWTIIYILGFPIIAAVGFSGTFFHLLCDFITGRTYGIEIFYPLSNRDFSLFEVDKNRGHFNPSRPNKDELTSYLSFYVQNKPALFYEVSINILGLISIAYLLII